MVPALHQMFHTFFRIYVHYLILPFILPCALLLHCLIIPGSFVLLVVADPPHVSLIPCQCPVSHHSGGRCRLECPDCIQAFHTSVLLLLFIVTNILSEYLSPTLFDSISDFGIAFFHTLHSLPHWQLS